MVVLLFGAVVGECVLVDALLVGVGWCDADAILCRAALIV